jgi:hypothetical protein
MTTMVGGGHFVSTEDYAVGVGSRPQRESVLSNIYIALAPKRNAIFGEFVATPIARGPIHVLPTTANVSISGVQVYTGYLSESELSVSENAMFGRELDSIWSDASRRSDTEAYVRLAGEVRTVICALLLRRGEDAQERFMFDNVMPLIERYGIPALAMLDEAITRNNVPDSARYYFAYMLGHMKHQDTLSARLDILNKYAISNVEALREGAEEAFGHLSAA